MIEIRITDVTPETIPLLIAMASQLDPSELKAFLKNISDHDYLDTCEGLMDALFEFIRGLGDAYWQNSDDKP